MRFREFFEASAHGYVGQATKSFNDLSTKLFLHPMDAYFAIGLKNGGIDITGDLDRKPNDRMPISLNPQKKVIVVSSKNWEYDPYTIGVLDALSKTRRFNDFVVATPDSQTTLAQLSSQIKSVSGASPTWALQKYDHKSALKRFGIKVIKEIWQRNFYHATFKKYLPLIQKGGLRQSDTINDIMAKYGKNGAVSLGDIPQSGWSNYNPDRQKAIYLFMNENNAKSLAQYLAYRNREPAMVLEIKGEAIKDYTKLVLDEDAMRDYWGDLEKHHKSPFPHFYTSVLSNLETIGYKGVISAQFISVVEEFKQDEMEQDED